MSPFRNFETSVLLDMLALQTEKLIQMFKEESPDGQYEECKHVIIQLQSEIESRRNSPQNVSVSVADISFKDGKTV
jgi:hypothetical protein